MAVRVGVGLFTGQIPMGSGRTFAREYRETLDLVRLAESMGFDSAWVSEHHGASDGYLPSLLPMLAALATSTERMQLGTGVVLAPLHDPLRLAEDAAVVDQLSGGRLILGLGIGWRDEEFRMFGVPRSERAIRTAETIDILRRAWTGRRFSFEGRAHSYDRVKVTPPPAREGGVPIHLGGSADTPDDDRLEPTPPDEETMRTWTPAGTPEEVLRALRPLAEAFGDRELHLIVRLHYPGMDLEPAARAVELFGQEILPSLKVG